MTWTTEESLTEKKYQCLMKINTLRWKNFTSWGNAWHELDFDTKSGLSLLCGVNGAGKCLSGDTEIEIEIEDKELYDDFIKFIENQ